MTIEMDRLKTTVLPFVYEAIEWPKPPRFYLQEYVNRMKLRNYIVFYNRDDTDLIHMNLLMDNEIYEASQGFYKLDTAEHNIIILTLINIFGYCDSADALLNLINTHKYSAPNITVRSRRNKKSAVY